MGHILAKYYEEYFISGLNSWSGKTTTKRRPKVRAEDEKTKDKKEDETGDKDKDTAKKDTKTKAVYYW